MVIADDRSTWFIGRIINSNPTDVLFNHLRLIF